jgi:LmbE family N-acetylglucosaminyl deacetylase
VCFHAHPDDEALLTAGTMAKAAAAGHRVVLVSATRGEVGEVAGDFLDAGEDLGERRWHELEQAAAVLGVARLEWLGYGDSGSGPGAPSGAGRAGARRFVDVPTDEAATRLAEILVEEQADVFTSYDPNGGYGHPDHLKVHMVGGRAARLAGTPRVFEATIDRDLLRLGVDMARSMGYTVPPELTPESFDLWYTPAEVITHVVDVSAHLAEKKAAMQAHASQATSAREGGSRTIDLFLGLPDDLFAAAFGAEWFIERDQPAGDLRSVVLDDVLLGGASTPAEGGIRFAGSEGIG